MPKTGPPEHPRPPPRFSFPTHRLDKPGLEAALRLRPRHPPPGYKAAGKLVDRHAVITGGAAGIGRAVAVLFAREGADVAIQFLPAEQGDADDTRAAVEAEGRRCVMIAGDVADAAFCAALVPRAVDQLGGLDILVSSGAHLDRTALADLTPEVLERTFRIEVFAYHHLTRAALPHLRPGAAIIATSHAASAGAIDQLTRVMAQQLLARGIRVNAVAPGVAWPPPVTNGPHTPSGHAAQPEAIAPAYVFLASEADASSITGIILPVLGGATVGG